MKNSIVLFFIIFSLGIYSQNDTVSLYYDIGIYKLNDVNYQKIDHQLLKLNDSANYEVEIIASADFLGSKKSNIILSKKRAKTVKKLLDLKDNVKITKISYRGLGELQPKDLEKTQKGIQEHRKSFIIFKNQDDVVFEKMKTAKKGDVFILKGILFEPGRHLLKKESLPILKKLLKTLQENNKLNIEISGHVCCGEITKEIIDAYDLDDESYKLSENRAKHIYKYLILKKIKAKRITYKGLGFNQPIYFPEESTFHRKQNRRVEIKILSNEN